MDEMTKSPYAVSACSERVMDYEYTFRWTEADRELLEKLQSFIPDKVFDAHAHIHKAEYMPEGNNIFQGYGTADMERKNRRTFLDGKILGIFTRDCMAGDTGAGHDHYHPYGASQCLGRCGK